MFNVSAAISHLWPAVHQTQCSHFNPEEKTPSLAVSSAQFWYSSYAMSALISHTLNGVSEEQRKWSSGGENDNPAMFTHSPLPHHVTNGRWTDASRSWNWTDSQAEERKPAWWTASLNTHRVLIHHIVLQLWTLAVKHSVAQNRCRQQLAFITFYLLRHSSHFRLHNIEMRQGAEVLLSLSTCDTVT